MTITQFTPWAGLLGGALIGLSAVLLMASQGRIAGISGIFADLLAPESDAGFNWRLIFIIGLLLGTAWSGLFFLDVTAISFSGGPFRMLAAGLLVGIGTVLGTGCTSGHGICGMARLSTRSLAATGTFMAVALTTVFITRHVLGA
jgi:uncharacterized protein